jgi:hypothetical protein
MDAHLALQSLARIAAACSAGFALASAQSQDLVADTAITVFAQRYVVTGLAIDDLNVLEQLRRRSSAAVRHAVHVRTVRPRNESGCAPVSQVATAMAHLGRRCQSLLSDWGAARGGDRPKRPSSVRNQRRRRRQILARDDAALGLATADSHSAMNSQR